MSAPSDVPEGFCSAGEYCSGGQLVRSPDGTCTREPAPTPRAFCEADRGRIAEALRTLPLSYLKLAAEIGQPVRRGEMLRVPFGPSIPLRGDVDACMRDTTEILCGWDERVRQVARLSPLDTSVSRHRDGARVTVDSCRLLGAHLDALLALMPEPMVRLGEDGALVLEDLGGAEAGNEILRLASRCRKILGESRPLPQTFDGIPCRQCGEMALERAEPPSNPEHEAMHSWCASCQHAMNLADYARWVRWYSRWADTAGLTCRRCLAGDCGECAYGLCACPIPVDHPRRTRRAALTAAA